jgi:hypothetical protein
MVRTCRFLPRIGRSGKVGGEDRRKGHVDFDGPFDACQDRSRGAETA